jgi:hypothetical protein
VKERRNKHGQLMCACTMLENHGGKPCVNKATMSAWTEMPSYESKRCTPCEIGRCCHGK